MEIQNRILKEKRKKQVSLGSGQYYFQPPALSQLLADGAT